MSFHFRVQVNKNVVGGATKLLYGKNGCSYEFFFIVLQVFITSFFRDLVDNR
jgi:hypothetical protein